MSPPHPNSMTSSSSPDPWPFSPLGGRESALSLSKGGMPRAEAPRVIRPGLDLVPAGESGGVRHPGRQQPGGPGLWCREPNPWSSGTRWRGADRKTLVLVGGCRCPWGSPLPQESWVFSPSWLWPVIASKRPGTPSGSLPVGAGVGTRPGRACSSSPSTARRSPIRRACSAALLRRDPHSPSKHRKETPVSVACALESRPAVGPPRPTGAG
uniref:uncharacterized protein LOC123453322 isoform X2 n=1 Tax=Jaculus jaculus TaxID=51337 RepID=UPI001E1B26D2|nr:uncharacterized protein LOC123453322 isoform X2 [Jaculus jaculus]